MTTETNKPVRQVHVLADEMVESVAVELHVIDDGEPDPMLELAQGEGCVLFPANLWRRLVSEVDAQLEPVWRASPGPGTCVHCGCQEFTACIDGDGKPCSWTDETQTLCTACTGLTSGDAA